MSMTRRRLLDDTFKKSVVGNPAIATDSLARMYPGITMQGWTEQPQYEGNQLFDASKLPTKSAGGATVTNNGDGSFTISGSGNLTSNFNVSYSIDISLLKSKNITIFTEKKTLPYIILTVSSTSGSVQVSNAYSNQEAKDISRVLSGEDVFANIAFYGSLGGTITPGTIKPMLYQYGDGTWEPYTGGQPSPSPEYPQEIVSAGNWNEEAQKWEYKITITNAQTDPDKNQTVTLTADRPLTKWDRLEKRGGQWGWVYKSEEIESYTDESVPGEYYSTTGQLSTGAQVWYETATETFAPLSESEREAMNALHTYRPTTVLSNQQGCQMTLTYKSRKGMS